MKKLVITVVGLMLVALTSVMLIPCVSSYADNGTQNEVHGLGYIPPSFRGVDIPNPSTNVTVVVGSPNDVNANLGVITLGTANVNVDVDSPDSNINVTGGNPNQTSFNGKTISGTMEEIASLAKEGQKGTEFNQQNYLWWIKPTRDKVDLLEYNVANDEKNLGLTMDGLAKAISLLQDQENRLKLQQQSMNELADNLSRSVAERQSLQNIMGGQFQYVDNQMQGSIDRDKTLLGVVNNVSDGINWQLVEHDSRIQSLANNYEMLKLANENSRAIIIADYQSLNNRQLSPNTPYEPNGSVV
jgi:hypothetical protein